LDRETPVSLYQRFSAERSSCWRARLGEATGRYSFIGLDRRWRVTTREAPPWSKDDGGDASLAHWTRFATSWLDTHSHASHLPDFFGGAVGS